METSERSLTTSLQDIPDELIEHIAFFAGTATLLGPPSALPTLVVLNKRFNRILSVLNNPHLYARIFISKFDVSAPLRRSRALNPNSDARADVTVSALASELVRRCRVLKRIRAQLDFLAIDPEIKDAAPTLDETLWTAYLMMLEHNRKNLQQLRQYATIDLWLRTYWFDPRGWGAKETSGQRWPKNDTRAALAMWLTWFFLDPAKYVEDIMLLKQTYSLVKPYALGAHKYPLSVLPWTSFTPGPSHIHFGVPGSDSSTPMNLTHQLDPPFQASRPPTLFSVPLKDLTPLPASIPAILTYLALRAHERNTSTLNDVGLGLGGALVGLDDMLGPHFGFMIDLENSITSGAFLAFPAEDSDREQDKRWEYEWTRALPVNSSETDMQPTLTFRPGSLEGYWEGVFSYTEFTSFAQVLGGGPPSTLQNSLIAQHRQTWRIREYHLLADVPFSPNLSISSSSYANPGSSQTPNNFNPDPLPEGDALCAHIPEAAVFQESSGALTATIPASATGSSSLQPSTFTYQRYSPEFVKEHELRRAEGGVEYGKRVRDILLKGEGHSSWGGFKLIGRVRRSDGFVSVSKVYTHGDRGSWLYRGYLVGVPSEGESAGYLVGRWRDTLSPVESFGYEGCFGMTRRG